MGLVLEFVLVGLLLVSFWGEEEEFRDVIARMLAAMDVEVFRMVGWNANEFVIVIVDVVEKIVNKMVR